MDFLDIKKKKKKQQQQAISYSGANWRVVHGSQELDLSSV